MKTRLQYFIFSLFLFVFFPISLKAAYDQDLSLAKEIKPQNLGFNSEKELNAFIDEAIIYAQNLGIVGALISNPSTRNIEKEAVNFAKQDPLYELSAKNPFSKFDTPAVLGAASLTKLVYQNYRKSENNIETRLTRINPHPEQEKNSIDEKAWHEIKKDLKNAIINIKEFKKKYRYQINRMNKYEKGLIN